MAIPGHRTYPADVTDAELTAPMMALHDELNERFFRHQKALLDRDFAAAAQHLAAFAGDLRAHIADEDTLVLPRYRALGGDASDAPVRLFEGEHLNLERFVAEFTARVAALQSHADDRALLELLDRQATFKNLMLHHDLRERNVLYPFLSARLPSDEQAEILRRRRWLG